GGGGGPGGEGSRNSSRSPPQPLPLGSPAPLGKPPPAQRLRGARWSACQVTAAGSMKPRPVLGVEQVAIAGVEAERYRAAGLHRRARPHLGDQPVAGGAVEMHERGVAERLGELHRALERGAVAQDDMLGPHPEHSPASGRRRRNAVGQRMLQPVGAEQSPAAHGLDRALDEVHGRRAEEAGHELRGWPVVYIERRADLLDAALAHHHDAVRHGHRLGLVMGDIDEGRVQPPVQRLELGAHVDSQFGVEAGQRLVHQEHGGIGDDGAGERHALALAARALPRQLVEQRLYVNRSGGRAHALPHLLLRHLLDAQAERDVLEHRHVREQREVLEHHAEPALAGLQIVDHGVADDDGRLVGASSPEIMFSVVVFPQPDGPTMIRNSLSRISRLIPFTAAWVPNVLTRFSITMRASFASPRLRRHLRMVPKLKPLTRCFWIRMPSTTTGMVIMVPIAACGPYSRPSEALWNLLSSTVSVVTSGWVRVSASRNSAQFRMNTNRKVTTMPEA